MDEDKKSTVYDLCGSGKKLNQQFWRNAFLTEICDMQIPEGTKVVKLTQEQKRSICAEKYTEAFAHLLILFGAGYVDYDVLVELSKNSEKYSDIIFDTEDFVINQAQENTNSQASEEVVRNIFLCAVNSRRYDRIQEVDFKTARRICGNIRLTVNGGFVFPRSNDFLTFLAKTGEPVANFCGKDMEDFSLESIERDFGEGKDSIEKLIPEDNKKYPKLPFLLNIRNAEQIAAIYGKPYAAEFVRYAREKHIPFDGNFVQRYEDFFRKEKLHFVISLISKKRNVCGDIVCWFDYGATEYQEDLIRLGEEFDKSQELDLKNDIDPDNEPTDDELLEKAIAEFLKDRTVAVNTVMEVTHGSKKYLYLFREDNRREKLDSDSFRHIPFDYNDLWTIIMEWSRSRKIVKKNNVVQIPPEEWVKVKPSERGFAQRLIDEQYFRQKEGNVMLQTLSELKTFAANEADKKAAREKGQSIVKGMINKNKEGSGNENNDS